MNIFIICAHPEPKSFNYAMFNTAVKTLEAQGHTVKTSDLYGLGFDPLSSRKNFTTEVDGDYLKLPVEEVHATNNNGFADDIEGEIQKLEWCDLMIWQFPLWWFGLPAALKGWVDRVFASGRIYGGARVYDNGMLKGKKAMISLSTGGSADAYVAGGKGGDLMNILRPIQRGMFEFVGFEVLAPHFVHAPVRKDKAALEEELDSYAKRLASIENETPIDVGVL